MADIGWIKLWRKLRDNPWLNDAVQRAVFCTLLLDAETDDERERSYGQGVAVVRRGQCIVAERALAIELKLGRQQIRRALANLKRGGLINPKTNPHFTLVTICNFSLYQASQPTEQPKANPRPTQLLESKNKNPLRVLVANSLPSVSVAPCGADHHPPEKSKPKKRATLIPDDWNPNVAYARGKGLTDSQINHVANRMIDWAKAKGITRVDWDAQFRNMVRGFLEDQNGGRPRFH